MRTLPLPSIHPTWKSRLWAAFLDILDFIVISRGEESLTDAQSADGRTILELVEMNGILQRADLQLALPHSEDLEMLKLGCWTLLFLKALFPDWIDLESWVKEAAEWATETGEPIEKRLQEYHILCNYNRLANVLEFRVVRSNGA